MWLKINRDKNKQHIIIYAAVSAVFAVVSLILGVNFIAAILGGGLLFCTLDFKFELSDSLPTWSRFLILAALTLVVFILMQVTISCGIFLIGFFKFIMNVLIMLGFASLFWMISGSIKVSTAILFVISYIVAIADHLVVQARSFEIQFSDINSIGTAAQVAGGYSFALSTVTKIGIVAGICFMTFVMRTHFPRLQRNWKRTVICLGSMLVTVLCAIVIYTQFCSFIFGYQDKYWKYRGSERNGFWVNMIYSASATRVITPNKYDADELSEEFDDYMDAHEETKSETETEEKTLPNVIVVMNESFSDVQHISEDLGVGMKTSIPVTPFLDSLTNFSPNVIKGHTLSSVYGGNTANSELEFLTGLSIQFIPHNTVAYNLYMTPENSFSIVDTFKKYGYTTVGLHPENKTNWQRDKMYSYFGFDQTVFADSFTDLTDEDYYRGHISDLACYEKVESIFAEKEKGKPMFSFVVTMQNHGGYTSSGFDYTVELEGYEGYTGIKEYLASINNSDKALQQLVDYFKNYDEDTVILFYGDHQPSLSNIAGIFFDLSDNDPNEKQEAKYIVPYLFWANYDIKCPDATSLTSINFLHKWLLDMVGLEGTQFDGFIGNVNKSVMAMNSLGWYDYNGSFHETDYNNAGTNRVLSLYRRLQYNALYDTDNKLTNIFGLPEIEKTAGE